MDKLTVNPRFRYFVRRGHRHEKPWVVVDRAGEQGDLGFEDRELARDYVKDCNAR